MDPIVVLDDEPDLRELVRIVLSDLGREVVVAASPIDAGLPQRASLVITDTFMSRTLEDVRAQVALLRIRFGAPVILFTASSELEARAHELGADDVIAKPFDLDTLLDRVRSMVPA